MWHVGYWLPCTSRKLLTKLVAPHLRHEKVIAYRHRERLLGWGGRCSIRDCRVLRTSGTWINGNVLRH